MFTSYIVWQLSYQLSRCPLLLLAQPANSYYHVEWGIQWCLRGNPSPGRPIWHCCCCFAVADLGQSGGKPGRRSQYQVGVHTSVRSAVRLADIVNMYS
jgi:hypothetical protein